MSVCFPCDPIQLSVACVRPSKHVFVVLGIAVEIVSIFGDVFGASRSHIQPIQLPKHSVRFVFHIFDESLIRIHIQMNSKLITSTGH